MKKSSGRRDVGSWSLESHYQLGDQLHHLILPPEILQMINEYILGGRPDKPNYFGSVPPQLCRVNSTWNRIFTPALYAHFRFHGSIKDFSSLYHFLHVLVQRPHLKAFVKELTLTTWGFYEEIQFHPRHLRQAFLFLWKYTDVFDKSWAVRRLRQTEHDSLANRQAFKSFCATCLEPDGSIAEEWKEPLKTAYAVAHYRLHQSWLDPVLEAVFGDLALNARGGLDGSEARMSVDISGAHLTPLTALVPALCPNLVRLNCDVWGTGEDPFFERIMGVATGRRPLPPIFWNSYRPLSRLESIQVAGRELPRHSSCPTHSRGRASISDYQNYWRLPRLKSLTILGAEMTKGLNNITPCALEHLTLQGLDLQPHLTTLFSLTRNLRQLSLFLDIEYSSTHTGDGTPARPTGALQYFETWSMLHHLKDQLEYLDLYQSPFHFPKHATPPFFNTTTNLIASTLTPFCPPLAEFSKLRQLNIPLLGLHGHNCSHNPGTKFTSHLPPSLEPLALYAEDAPWVQQHIDLLDAELENIALCNSRTKDQTGKSKSAPLKAIIAIDFHEILQRPAARMEAAACREGIFCAVNGDKYVTFCGQMTGWGLMNNAMFRWRLGVLEKMDPGRVIPRGMSVYGVKGRL